MKKIAILTSGGDAPGMNACLRACVRYAIYNNLEVYGVERGYLGLINDDIFPMNTRSVSGIVQRGGTILKSARSQEFCTEEGIKKAAANLHVHGITTLIVIGGDGTFKGGKALSDNYDVNVIGIPGTIDNDLQYTDFTIGFDTAVNTCLWAINSLRDTMDSHDRASLVEVMGRHCGDIALHAGICGGAEYILTPEVPFDLDEIAKGLKRGGSRGKTSNMIVFAEGAGNRDEIVKYLSEKSGVNDVRQKPETSVSKRFVAQTFITYFCVKCRQQAEACAHRLKVCDVFIADISYKCARHSFGRGNKIILTEKLSCGVDACKNSRSG